MSAVPRIKYLTPEEYLAIERQAEDKSEYVDGLMYAMAGGSPQHSSIAMNVSGELYIQLKGTRCQVFNSDLKVRVPSKRKYLYPNVTVACGEPEFDGNSDAILNPLLMVEVLSKTTAGYDQRNKFLCYQEIDSFQEYLLIALDQPTVQHYVKQPNGTWVCTTLMGLDQSVELPVANCRLHLSEIYAKVLA
jgi:Uma2 family endonuclease